MIIGIFGDSFAADTSEHSWVSLLSKDHTIKHYAQAGVSEYKILEQVKKAKDIDAAIVCHTSHSRIHVTEHPVYKEGYHKECDLLYADMLDKYEKDPSEINKAAYDFFRFFYDDEYYKDVYELIRRELEYNLNCPSLHIDHFEYPASISITREQYRLDMRSEWHKHRGDINHYTIDGNKLLYEKISSFWMQ